MSPQPEKASAMAEETEYSREERRELLRVARDAIGSAFQQREPAPPPESEHLREPRGAFTTLHLEGKLRGCVGYIFPVLPLYRTVAETAIAAAFHDLRFPPLVAQELPYISVEISVLSLLQPTAPEDVEIGRHGLLITYSRSRGLLLPQVPLEDGWDRETFLAETCRKAGLPLDAWRHGATIEAFTAEIFSDESER